MNLENKNYKNIFISFLMGIFLSIIPIVIHSDAYCRDDMQVQYMPTFYAIGSTFLHAHLVPFITTHTWFGGNLIGEFQYGILNPIELALYSILPFIKSIQYGADFIAVFHYGILSSGMFFWQRRWEYQTSSHTLPQLLLLLTILYITGMLPAGSLSLPPYLLWCGP